MVAVEKRTDNPIQMKTHSKDAKCAPGKKFEDGSCIPLSLLVRMAEAYNRMYPDNQIVLNPTYETLRPGKYKRELVSEFSRRLDKVCDDQKCWVKQEFMKVLDHGVQEELRKHTWRPKGPQGKFTWLNTVNIKEVMEQYEQEYPDFKFLGAVPIDFDELPDLGIRDIDFRQLYKEGKTKVGCIFNLDEHDQPGSHWVSMYSDLEKGTVYFSDSYGVEPEARIRKLMRRIARSIQDRGVKAKVDHNKVRAQRKGSECGVYSIAFIARQLKGDSFEDICKEKVPDDLINQCRKVYFTQ